VKISISENVLYKVSLIRFSFSITFHVGPHNVPIFELDKTSAAKECLPPGSSDPVCSVPELPLEDTLGRTEPEPSVSKDADDIIPLQVDDVAATYTSPTESAKEVSSPIWSPSLPISYLFYLIIDH